MVWNIIVKLLFNSVPSLSRNGWLPESKDQVSPEGEISLDRAKENMAKLKTTLTSIFRKVFLDFLFTENVATFPKTRKTNCRQTRLLSIFALIWFLNFQTLQILRRESEEQCLSQDALYQHKPWTFLSIVLQIKFLRKDQGYRVGTRKCMNGKFSASL